MAHGYIEMEFQVSTTYDDDFDIYSDDDDDDDEFETYISDEEFDPYIQPYILALFGDSDGDLEPFFGYTFVVYGGPEPGRFGLEEEQANDAPAAPFTGRLKMTVVNSKEQCATCAICLEEMEVGQEAAVLDCSHNFHENCLRQWLAVKLACPCCRAVVASDC